MRSIDDRAIKAHADLRFRSEYDYALFEYYRSAKVFAFLDAAGARFHGRVLDAGCGGGGMPLSFAEEADEVVAIDLVPRFRNAGTRLAQERGIANLHFLQADGQALPFADGAFDVVLSHAVIEHVADAPRYLRECARVLKPGGWMYLSTAPYLSFAGAHLPRLKVPSPAAPHRRTPRRICDVPLSLATRDLDAQGTGERELVHQARPARHQQTRRPAREGAHPALASSSCRCGIRRGHRRPLRDRHVPPAADRTLAARQPADAGHRHRSRAIPVAQAVSSRGAGTGRPGTE